ncbi:unnamed protein product [Mycena citricolor]|uniref:Uncharacterized protein n=1 Tax=Mycena citricolor TaxID=2018698 RepID=A0AAD2HW58_9AGAR|nr:unnamed protein product [Mycena citricolor]CAK5270205.1 unnamed protein product [Mycena citricolor]CAK5275199.1 unnamed protein product [Mycena citricolor]CAK5282230.1 unnamed protein product [Mycena citricolor]
MAPKTGFKIPQPWDTSRPILDEKDPLSIEAYLRHCAQIVEDGGITDVKQAKSMYIRYLPSRQVMDVWEGLDTYSDDTKTVAEFEAEILKGYPEVSKRKTGTMADLDRLCRENRGIKITDEGDLKRFGLQMYSHYKRLSVPPAIITNKVACERYMRTLDSEFSTVLRNALATSQVFNKRYQTRAGIANANVPATGVNRQDDPIQLKELMTMAEEMASTLSNEDEIPIIARPPKVRFDYETSPPNHAKVEELENSISNLKDSFLLHQKELQTQLQEALKTFLPNGEGTQGQRVEAYWKKKGKSVNFQDSYYLDQFDSRDNDDMSDYPEEVADEIRSLRSQLIQYERKSSRPTPESRAEPKTQRTASGSTSNAMESAMGQFMQKAMTDAMAGYFNNMNSGYPQTQEQFIQTRRGANSQPERDDNNSAKPSEDHDKRAERREKPRKPVTIEEVSDSDDDEESVRDNVENRKELPFEKVKPVLQEPVHSSKARVPDKYQLRAPIQKKAVAEAVYDKMKNASVDVTVGELLAVSGTVRDSILKDSSKKRVPVQKSMLQETGRVVEDVWDGELSYNLVSAKELPEPVFYHNTVEGEIPIGAVVATDPYEMYLESIPSNENPRHVYVGDSSAALRTINGRINARLDADCILDSGSQIVSMAFSEAVDAQLSWDPKVVIYMESANGSISKSLGLARNVPFRFGTILVYLQVHILESPAYKVLLGRPFDIATESNIKNAADGSQIITMRDPNLKTRCAMATQPRRADDLPRNTKNNDGSTEPYSSSKPTASPDEPNPERDFQRASRN